MRGRTLMPTKTECDLLAIPTTTEPCLTASAAYSTWNIRPCGELDRVKVLLLATQNQTETRQPVGDLRVAHNVTESLS